MHQKMFYCHKMFSKDFFTKCSLSYSSVFLKKIEIKQLYHEILQSTINKQINEEQRASQQYLAFAIYFGKTNVSRRGCFNYFMSLHKDELHHAQSLIQYQLLRGGNVKLDTIDAPLILESACISEYFQHALELEYKHTNSLQHAIKIAQHYEDNHCIDFIATNLLREQVTSTNALAGLIQNLKTFDNNHAMFYIFDKHLMKSYPFNNN